jgi:DNA-directed RNA polymerase subunit RPC12/RpoP
VNSYAGNGEGENMDHECKFCGKDYTERDEEEPTPLCDQCAHKEVERLRELLSDARGWLNSRSRLAKDIDSALESHNAGAVR